MKSIFVVSAIMLSSVFASAAPVECQLLKIENGKVVSESKVVKAAGDVDLSINDFEKSQNIVGKVRGDTNEPNALQLVIYHTQLDVSASAASVQPTTTVELHAQGERFALTCWE